MSKFAENKSYLPGLDLLRFVAAILVVFYHFGFHIWAENVVPVTYRWTAPFSWFGFVGVEIFFTLSGFVIAYTAVKATPFSFVQSRLSRLIPGTAICATLTLLACLAFHADNTGALLKEWIHSAILPIRIPFLDGSYWTLPIELAFYSVVLFLIVLRREWLLTRVMGVIGMISTAMWLGLSVAYAAGWRPAFHYFYVMQTRQSMFVTLLPHGCIFAVGVLLWFCLTHRSSRNRLAVLIVCIAGGVAENYWHSVISRELHDQQQGWQNGIPCALWLVSLVAIVLSVKKNKAITAALQPLLPGIRWAGLLTYPLYLLHQRVGYLLIEGSRTHIGDNGSLFFVTFLMIVSALLIAQYCEPPLRKSIQRGLASLNNRVGN